MMKDYIFHYNGDMANKHENVEPGEMTYHEHLVEEDGKHCRADMNNKNEWGWIDEVVAYFDDGNELSVWIYELEEVK